MHDQVRLTMAAEHTSPVTTLCCDASNCCLPLFSRSRKLTPQIWNDVTCLHGKNGSVGRKSVERTGGIQHFLHVSIEVGNVYSEIDSGSEGGSTQQRNHWLHRERAQDR